jgi:hypothetical protein
MIATLDGTVTLTWLQAAFAAAAVLVIAGGGGLALGRARTLARVKRHVRQTLEAEVERLRRDCPHLADLDPSRSAWAAQMCRELWERRRAHATRGGTRRPGREGGSDAAQ